ncbi:MAG: NADH-quinone oxidoreductase subunit NuoD [Chloroflexi bacterium HGW-Chloroflexi-1]|nr:MAG: NADH-quinone oxidoreductase subunit NuoD [Chloroflexi bacterium HGW-Chloroflexi-1]
MADPTILTTAADSTLPFDDAVSGAVLEATPNGLVVAADKLLELATYLRDQQGYDYLSMVTSVDWPPYFEVVYYLYGVAKPKDLLVLKVRLPDKVNSVVPSLISIWPGADLQEREVYDMMGIRFAGHPNLRRILLWDGFQGWPLRKDYKESYYEEDTKPFKSRHPDGKHLWAEDRVPWKDNITYPVAWDPDLFTQPTVQYRKIMGVDAGGNGDGKDLKTERVLINMGPQHPSTHGVFRMVVAVEGEQVVGLEPEIGYLHRCHEKIGERNTYIMNIPFTDRLDYITSMSNNLGYVLAVEKLMGLEAPERADYIRVIMAEFTRIISHFIAVGFLFNDLGAYFTPALYGLRERELILDLFEAAAGSRMMCNYMRFGGVFADLPAGWVERARDLVWNRLPRVMEQFEDLLAGNEIFLARARGVGHLSAAEAIAYSMAGPMLRASGVPYDIRKVQPYSIYDRFEFDVCCRPEGDVWARFRVRMDEIYQSLRILKQALDGLPEGPIMPPGKRQYQIRVPAGEAYSRIEGPKGELGFYVVSDGKPNPYRYHVRAPTFINLTSLEKMCVGHKIADSVVILGAIDIVLGEVDR